MVARAAAAPPRPTSTRALDAAARRARVAATPADRARRGADPRRGVAARAAAEIAALEVRETAKPWREADGDVCEAIDFLEYYARAARSSSAAAAGAS